MITYMIYILLIVVGFVIFFKVINNIKTNKNIPDLNIETRLVMEYEPIKQNYAHINRIKERLHKNIGEIDQVCPYCKIQLKKRPTRKTRCKNCNNFIYVTERPYDSKSVLVTEKDKKILLKDKSNLRYFLQEDFFDYEQELKKIRKGGYTPPSDVYWYKLQCQALQAFAEHDYQKLSLVYLNRALELERLKNYDGALDCFFQADYLSVCGATKSGFSVFQKPKDHWGFAFYNTARCIKHLNISEDEYCDRFYNNTYEQLAYPIKLKDLLPTIRTVYKSLSI